MKDWYPLDNAAKVFPAVKSGKNSAVYRISVIMKEPVDEEKLQQAADTVAGRFPMFMVSMKKGIFWNYLEKNSKGIQVMKDERYPCHEIIMEKNQGHLMKILYYHHRISVEFFHVLTDGKGAAEFLKSLLFYYLLYSGHSVEDDGMILLENDITEMHETDDSFLKYSSNAYYEKMTSPNSYRIKGTNFEIFGFEAVHGVMESEKLLSAAKKRGGTVTAYLTAALIYSIYQSNQAAREKKRPIVVAVPVNLRKVFPSQTLRNFFGVVNIGVMPKAITAFEDLVRQCDELLRYKTNASYLQNIICKNVAIESKGYIQGIPLFIKKWLITAGFKQMGEKKKTLSLTNLGKLEFPDSMKQHIVQAELLLYPTPASPINCGVITKDDSTIFTFTRSIAETDLIQTFFSFLANEEKLQIRVYSNDWGRQNDAMQKM